MTKTISDLFDEGLERSQKEVSRAAALHALRNLPDLDQTLGAFVKSLKKQGKWVHFAELTLGDLANAINPPPRASSLAPPPGKRLTKAQRETFTEEIRKVLSDSGEVRCVDIAARIGLNTKQTATLLRRLRQSDEVACKGARAAMVYYLKSR